MFIEHLEDTFLELLATKAPRLALPPMPKPQRTLVHEYAEQGWGLVTHSSGNEPNRAVQLFKAPSSGWWVSGGVCVCGGGGRRGVALLLGLVWLRAYRVCSSCCCWWLCVVTADMPSALGDRATCVQR